MDAASTAVAGPLPGVARTPWFRGRAAERTAALARTEQLRQERTSPHSDFAGAVADHRRSRNDHWFRAGREPGPEEAEESRHAPCRQRTTARQALFRVQPACDGPETRRPAEAAFAEAHRTHETAGTADRARRSGRTKRALARFIAAAADAR